MIETDQTPETPREKARRLGLPEPVVCPNGHCEGGFLRGSNQTIGCAICADLRHLRIGPADWMPKFPDPLPLTTGLIYAPLPPTEPTVKPISQDLKPTRTPDLTPDLTRTEKAELILLALIRLADGNDLVTIKEDPNGEVDVFQPSYGQVVVTIGDRDCTRYEDLIDGLFIQLCTIRGRAHR